MPNVIPMPYVMKAWAVLSLLVFCVGAVGLSYIHANPVEPIEPIELPTVPVVGVNPTCTDAWIANGPVEFGYAVSFRATPAYTRPVFFTDAQLEASFTRPDGTVDEDQLDRAREALVQVRRIECRWSPLSFIRTPAN